MRFVVAKLNSASVLVALAIAAAYVVFVPQLTGAQQTTISTAVCSSSTANFAIDTPANNSVVDRQTVTITGSVWRISQLQVYRNNMYESVNPIDAGSTHFSITVQLSVGDNTITLKGIDPCSANTYESTLLLHYVPGATPTPQPQEPNPIVAVVKDTQQASMETVDYLQGQVSQAAQTQPFVDASNVLYKGLVALDLASPLASASSMNTMVTRATLITTGAIMMMAAQSLVTGYHYIRYRFLQWNVHALPEFVHHHAVFVIRLAGIALSLAPFLLLT